MKVSIDSVQSVSIRNEYKNSHCRHAEYLGSFQHPQHLDSQDWAIHLYSVCDALVFATNGDPVWQQGDHEAFDSLLDTYGIDLENASDEDVCLHDYKSGDIIRTATPQEAADSREAAKSDKGAGVILVNGRSCYVSR